MPGAVDANGVYIYAEDDLLSPFSDLLNKGANAASALALRAPRGVLPNGYAVLTGGNTTVNAITTITTTPVDIPGLSCAVTVGTNRRIKVTFDGMLFSSIANDQGQVGIRDGSSLMQWNTTAQFATASRGFAAHVEAILAPSPGLHTYKIAIGRQAGTGNINMIGGSGAQSFILVEDIGSST